MSPAAFLDANVPIYAAGAEHPCREPCGRILRLAADYPRSFVTDVEVLQELLHRYRSLGRWDLGKQTLADFAELMHDRMEPVQADDLGVAVAMADSHPHASARDLVHAAVMARLGVDMIVTADSDFDSLPGVRRLDPADVDTWRASLL